jgi:tetratricopeptide (TPR) repeat protein
MSMSESDTGIGTARALLGAGETIAAVEQLRRLLDVDPQRVDALTLLGHALIRAGRFDQACMMLERAHQLSPADIGILHALGGACHQVGLYDRAQAYLEKATRHAPESQQLWYSLGLVRHAAGYFHAAIEAYDCALKYDPRNAITLAGKGKVLQVLGQLESARVAFDAALEADPECIPARVGLATRMEMDGRYKEATKLLEPALEHAEANPEVAFAWSRLLVQQGRSSEASAVIRSLLGRPASVADRSHAYFALGDLHDAEAEYDEAARCYLEANRIRKSDFDPVSHERRTAGIVSAWSGSAVAEMETAQNDSEYPVFIVGMPRSGTSLVEQILASHASVHPAGELTNIPDLARQWQRQDGVVYPSDLGQGCLSAAGEDYLRSTAGESAAGPIGVARVTDKMPSNFQHLGLIQALFPHARVVHCGRDPIDTALSCFFQDFSGRGLAWSNDLKDIETFYCCYCQLMMHWKSVLSLPILDIDYERLVDDPETQAKRLLEFIGLPWDPGCLDFHENRRVVTTASNKQVRCRIYTTSVGRSTNYRPYLKIPSGLERGQDD